MTRKQTSPLPASVSTSPPASARRPAVVIAGRQYKPTDPAPDGNPAHLHLRHALYSGRLPPADWPAAEQALLIAVRAQIGTLGGSKGGSAKGPSKVRGGPAHYTWLVACREAKRAGLPQPPKPKSEQRKGKASKS